MTGADKEKAVIAIAQRLQLTPEKALMLAERAEELFLSETWRAAVPARAFWLWVDVAAAIHRQEAPPGDAADGQGGKISSVKRGDTTINYTHAGTEATQNLTSSLISRIREWKVARAR